MDLVLRIILLHIPQAFLFTFSGLGLVGIRPTLRSIVTVSCFLGVFVEILRNTIFPWHAVTMLFVQGVIQRYYFRIGWGTSFAAAFLSFIMLNLGEAVIALAVLPLFGYTLSTVLHESYGVYIIGWLAQLPLLVAAFGVHRWGWVLFPLDAGRRGERGAAR